MHKPVLNITEEEEPSSEKDKVNQAEKVDASLVVFISFWLGLLRVGFDDVNV